MLYLICVFLFHANSKGSLVLFLFFSIPVLFFCHCYFFLLLCKTKQKSCWHVAVLYNLLPGGLRIDSFILFVHLELDALFHVIPMPGTPSSCTSHPSTHPPTHPPTHSLSLLSTSVFFFFFLPLPGRTSAWVTTATAAAACGWQPEALGVLELQQMVTEVEERCPSVCWDPYCLSVCLPAC